jgi:hypothetical protein
MSVKFPLRLPFLRAKEAARFIGVSCRTLEKHRICGTGPKYMKVGGRIIYAVTDLREWAERGARRATSDPGRTTILSAKPVDKASRIGPVGWPWLVPASSGGILPVALKLGESIGVGVSGTSPRTGDRACSPDCRREA